MPITTFRIHHLSDIHFGPAHYRPMTKQPVPVRETRNADAYLAHLGSLKEGDFPDLVVISGDFTTSAQEDEMAASSAFLSAIAESSAWRTRKQSLADKPRVLIVPGNHDMDWTKESQDHKQQRFGFLAETVRDGGKVASSVYFHTKPQCAIDLGDESNVFLYLLNSTSLGGIDDPALRSLYDTFRKHAFGATPEEIEAFRKVLKKDPGFVNPLEIAAMKEAAGGATPGRIKIAVVHHHPNHVPSDDVDSFDTIINAGLLKAGLIESGFDFVLHGHRHVFYCSAEVKPGADGHRRQVYFVGADSLGCQSHAPFVELSLINPENAHRSRNADSRFILREFSYASPNGYRPEPVICDEPLNAFVTDSTPRTIYQTLLDTAVILDGATEPADNPKLQEAIRVLMPRLQNLQSRWTDWDEDSDWIRQFHFQIESYLRIYATANYDRPTSENPNYLRYLQEQFDERLKRLKMREDKILYFSPEVFRAITRTGWRPDPILWKDYRIAETAKEDSYALEIARVIICDSRTLKPTVLRNLDHDHRLFAIPLFVVSREDLDTKQAEDFAIGVITEGRPFKACSYDREKGRVAEQNPLRAWELIATFEELLKNKKTKTVDRYLGRLPMSSDTAASGKLAEVYSKLRKTSGLILKTITRHVSGKSLFGLDLCCGTGNYTLPFADQFEQLVGLDINKEMLAHARDRNQRIRWIEADAKDTTLESESCDAIWMISALHYFKDAEQPMLFKEVFRILKPGGVFIADTEFLEQHQSLWIVEYLPSLKERYRYSLFSQDQYRQWLSSAGFQHIDFETSDYLPEEGDAFLRIGQHKPELYLDPDIQNAIPALRDMPANERVPGLRRLKEDIGKREISRVVERYKMNAAIPGDLGFIIARKA